MHIIKSLLLIAALSIFSFAYVKPKPVLYIIGDSTVKNGTGKGESDLWGWGSIIGDFFKKDDISIENRAIGGRSSRTFLTEGRWNEILKTLKKGDFVLIQFGHNDAGPLDDTARARGSIRGIGEESKDIYNPIRKVNETVYSYGYYMRKYVNEARAKGAIPIICSPVPRNNFKDGKTARDVNGYTLWAKQVADASGAFYIDLHNLIADEYDKLGAKAVDVYFPKDHTHPNYEGSKLNAAMVVQGIKSLKRCKLKKHLK